jgi:hypothetical protein
MTTCRKRTPQARAITLQRRAQRALKYGQTTTNRKAR